MNTKKCFEVWADNVFLGYEYGETHSVVLDISRQKYSDPVKWNIIEYTVKQLTKEIDNEK